MTHAELCKVGARWLLNYKGYQFRCNYVVTEFVSFCHETPDVFGFKGGSQTILLEVKVSRSDFLADKKKRHRSEGMGVGQFRYYLCPFDLIRLSELPKGWGLLFCDNNGKIEVVKMSESFHSRDFIDELSINYSIMRRLAKKRQVFDFKLPIPNDTAEEENVPGVR